jgi:MFS family permease
LPWLSSGQEVKFPSTFSVKTRSTAPLLDIGANWKIAGGIPPYIYADIGGVDRWIWFVLAYLIALAGVCPFVGSLSDLLGRRYVALIGSTLIIVGIIVSSTAHHMNPFIGELEVVFPSRVKSLSAVKSATRGF